MSSSILFVVMPLLRMQPGARQPGVGLRRSRLRRCLARSAAVGLLVLAPVAAASEDAAGRAGAASAAKETAQSRAAGPGHGAARNRLAGEASPYLQLHAANPVDWYPWGSAAFEKARAESKPIFVSIGYSTCYWCHVMEREVFASPQIAALMNELFVNVKVDREERPDVDEIYMTATQVLTGSGGWPNSVFLTPEGKPFFAGTYFPPEERGGRPGFPRVLRTLGELWKEDRARILQVAERVAATVASQAPPVAQSREPPDPAALLRRAVADLERLFEPEHGGFSARTKFPTPTRLEVLLAARTHGPKTAASRMLTRTLDEMALGGIFDHLGGGFHRYSTEPTWSLPHFEKMLYDNAQLVGLYARAHAATGKALYRVVAERTIAYLAREMRLPEGGFASAQDAEVGGREGASYVWTRAQIEAVLGPERAARFLSVYELRPLHGSGGGVLRVRLPLEQALARFEVEDVAVLLARFAGERSLLLAARQERAQPLRDDKVLTAWNGLAIRGLVEAADALGEPEPLRMAEAAARFVLARLAGPDGSLHRSYIAGQRREAAVLDDYAFLADGLLALHRATGDAEWRRRAEALADAMLVRFGDPEHGGFYLTPAGTDLFTRPRAFHDGEIPSGNGVAFRVLRQLGASGGKPAYAEAMSGTITGASRWLEQSPAAVGSIVVELASRPAASLPRAARARAAAAKGARPVFPRSEDHVQVRAERAAAPGPALVARITVAPGWHVNANPASLAYLVPTRIELEGEGGLRDVRYPPGETFHPEFARDPIAVYAGSVTIEARLDPDLPGPVQLRIQYQACNARVCLPPGESRLEVPPAR